MEKAYDLKDLTEKLKGRGLDLAEEAAKIALEEVLEWVIESATLSETPLDDVVALIAPKLKEFALEYIDKIDGEVDA
jgi:hypothetical protein